MPARWRWIADGLYVRAGELDVAREVLAGATTAASEISSERRVRRLGEKVIDSSVANDSKSTVIVRSLRSPV